MATHSRLERLPPEKRDHQVLSDGWQERGESVRRLSADVGESRHQPPDAVSRPGMQVQCHANSGTLEYTAEIVSSPLPSTSGVRGGVESRGLISAQKTQVWQQRLGPIVAA